MNIRTIHTFAFVNDSIIRPWKTPSKNDKYHNLVFTIYYEVNKPKIRKKSKKKSKKNEKRKTQESLNNIRIRFPT